MIYISFFEYMLYIYTSNNYMHICHRQIHKWSFKLLFGCLGLYKTWYFTYLNYSTYPGFPVYYVIKFHWCSYQTSKCNYNSILQNANMGKEMGIQRLTVLECTLITNWGWNLIKCVFTFDFPRWNLS